MNAPHRYSGNVTRTPHCVTRNSSSRVNHCSVIQVSSLLMTQAWHLTWNKVFHPDLLSGAICRWNEPQTFQFRNTATAVCIPASSSSSRLFTPPSPSSASQPVCSLISPCPERIDEALVSSGMFIGERSPWEEIGLEQREECVEVHRALTNTYSSPA